ncbi:O-Antigen ligase [Ruminococcaceae bacterium FB2012]|nr:O-Antigen ligase [Ruminococcaceae bacterium FB2012]
MSTVKKKLNEIAELITTEKAFYLLIMITMISLPVCELLVEQHNRNFEGQPIIVEAAGIAGVIMVVARLLMNKGPDAKFYATDVIYFCLIIFAGLSLAFTEDMLASVQGYDYDEWLTHFMAYFSLMYAGTMIEDKRLRRNIIKAFIFVLILQGGIGLMQSLGYEFTNCFYDGDAATKYHFAYGLTPHYNWYVGLMSLATGCVMGLCVFSKRRTPFLLTLVGTVLGMYAMLATETRLALLSLAALMIFYPVALLIYKLKTKDKETVKKAFLHWCCVALILAAMLLIMILGFGKFKQKMELTLSEINGTATFSHDAEMMRKTSDIEKAVADAVAENLDSETDSAADSEAEDELDITNVGMNKQDDDPMNGWPEEEKYTSFDNFATGRGHIWKFGLACVPDHWMFGVGLDNYRWCFTHAPDLPHDTWSQGKGHNELIHYLVTQGVFQLLTILSLVVYTFVVSIRTALHAEDREDKLTSFILIGMVTAYFVQSMFNSSVVNIAPYYWVVIGLCLCKKYQKPFGYRKSLKAKEQTE